MKPRSALRRESGFTLIELLLVSTLGLALLGACGTLLVSTVHSEARTTDRASSVPQARVMIDGVTHELRTGIGVETAQPNRLVLRAYVKRATCGGAAATSSIQCRVSYDCAAGRCTRSEGPLTGALGTPVEVVRGIAAEDVFTYTPSSTAPNYVGVRLRMPGATPGEDDVTLQGGVALRNAVLAG